MHGSCEITIALCEKLTRSLGRTVTAEASVSFFSHLLEGHCPLSSGPIGGLSCYNCRPIE